MPENQQEQEEKKKQEERRRRTERFMAVTVIIYIIVASCLTASFCLFKPPPVIPTVRGGWEIPVLLTPDDQTYEIKVSGKDLKARINKGSIAITNDAVLFEISPFNIAPSGRRNKNNSPNPGPPGFSDSIRMNSVPAIIAVGDGKYYTRAYLPHGWELRFSDFTNVKTSMKTGESRPLDALEFVEELEDGAEYTLILEGRRIPAILFLDPRPFIEPQGENPFKLLNDRAPAGSPITFELDYMEEIDREARISVLFHSGTEVCAAHDLILSRKTGEAGSRGAVAMPGPTMPSLFGAPYLALAMITRESGETVVALNNVYSTNKWWGAICGITVVVGLYVLGMAFLRGQPFPREKNKDRHEKWWDLNLWQKATRMPFIFALSKAGRFRISNAQIQVWTIIVIFAITFVIITTREFLPITAQMLWLLGISGVTMLFAKLDREVKRKRIPEKYTRSILFNRIPRYRDLITTGEVLNLYQVQIAAFTVVAGVYVIWVLLLRGYFPELDQNLLILMGISGGTYVLGEAISKNRWDNIDEKVKKLDEIENFITDKRYIEEGWTIKKLNKEIEETRKGLCDLKR
ncbi:MAG TPA: hypothetical protein VMX35_10110 [Acidobacteriota bacterium]|nr:hypothetical protein [Acidobacteriota bacterium]